MKKLLATLILILMFQTPSQADDISDFQIEGMSIGDSALDFFSEDELKNARVESYKDKKFLMLGIWKEYKLYDVLQIYVKPNEILESNSVISGNYKLDLFDEAIDNFNVVITLNDKSYKSNYILSEIYNIKGDYANGRYYAKESIKIKKNGAAYFHLGIAEKKIKNILAAKDAFGKAKKYKDWRASAVYELDLIRTIYDTPNVIDIYFVNKYRWNSFLNWSYP